MTDDDDMGVAACVFAVCTGAWLGATYLAGKAEQILLGERDRDERGR